MKEYCMVYEKHEDGSPHTHIYLELKKKLTTRNANYFDLPSEPEGQIVHGNYQGVKSKASVLEYIMKDVVDENDVVTNMYISKEGRIVNIEYKATEIAVTHGGREAKR